MVQIEGLIIDLGPMIAQMRATLEAVATCIAKLESLQPTGSAVSVGGADLPQIAGLDGIICPPTSFFWLGDFSDSAGGETWREEREELHRWNERMSPSDLHEVLNAPGERVMGKSDPDAEWEAIKDAAAEIDARNAREQEALMRRIAQEEILSVLEQINGTISRGTSDGEA
jgi:hypothetical protein